MLGSSLYHTRISKSENEFCGIIPSLVIQTINELCNNDDYGHRYNWIHCASFTISTSLKLLPERFVPVYMIQTHGARVDLDYNGL